jgi:hypothetical protein
MTRLTLAPPPDSDIKEPSSKSTQFIQIWREYFLLRCCCKSAMINDLTSHIVEEADNNTVNRMKLS